jgi:hypothetical protein
VILKIGRELLIELSLLGVVCLIIWLRNKRNKGRMERKEKEV